ELGQLFHNLGSEVTLMQRSPRLLKEYDPEISEAIAQALTEQGINLVTGASFERIEQDGDIKKDAPVTKLMPCNLVTGASFERIEQDGDIKKVYVEVDGEKRIIEAEQLL